MPKSIISKRLQNGGLLAMAVLCAGALAGNSEKVTLTTSYPSPVGIYQQIITTGGSAADPRDTILARDRRNVGIGTAAPRSPAPNNQQGNLDVNDVWLRGATPPRWASQSGSSLNCTRRTLAGVRSAGPGNQAISRAEVTCNAGEYLLTGGVDCTRSITHSSFPLMNGARPSGWHAFCYANQNIGSWTTLSAMVYAVCCQM